MKWNDVRKKPSHKVLLYGDPMSGKSTLASQLAEQGFKLIWVSMDNKHFEILGKLSDKAKENLDVIVLPDTKDFPVAISTCLKLVTGAKIKICWDHGQVDCSTCRSRKLFDERSSEYAFNDNGPDTVVVFDHISQLGESAMSFVTKNEKDDFKPGWDEYAKQGFILNKVLVSIQQASWNSICIAHTVEAEFEDKTKRLVPQCGTGNFSRNVAKFFDSVIHCRVLNKNHRFGSSTTYMPGILTGSRNDKVIEQLGDKEASLAMFFDGSLDVSDSDSKEILDAARGIRQVEVPQVLSVVSQPASGKVSAGGLSDAAREALEKLKR